MSTEQDIKTIRTSDGRGTVRVLVLSSHAQGNLFKVVRVDGVGSGNPFMISPREIIG